ncbi:SpoIVB peptidase [Paenibacillus sediminis]|uniref:Stage IV sporulation protein B n=1 Tax=Paenibacillus sediminis TaxID=664909 RepID=A0ABS4GZG5_9BACL|nr:SpoIVB peptidase [Paenibacillus sediminis]MBP1935672.1 stage IV sporulation protein B [Paenibacillus sediminis]
MKSNLSLRLLGLLLAFFVCCLGTSESLQSFASIPNELRLFTGQQARINLAMPVQGRIVVNHPEVLHLNGLASKSLNVSLNNPLRITSQQAGKTLLTLKIFGGIPLKTVSVNVIPDLKVIPGGQTIGVKVKSAGILVVGHHLVKTSDTSKISPGEEAGIQLGDLITHLNGVATNDVNKMAQTVEQAGLSKKPLKITLKRGNREVRTKITPAYDVDDKAWRLGLYIRDSAAGVGTLTFYAPNEGVYGALGHVITDMNTQTPIIVGSGQIVQSNVTSISKSQDGEPGEKRAHFLRESKVLGSIERNTHFGIFGKMNENPDHSLYNTPIPVAFSEEVKEGPAEILTVVNGQQVERFKVEIVHVSRQDAPATKGIVLRITDPNLIEKTGGIVQGMSGSPIVQNGKLVGAVTHVFVNDPKSGYGCFIEWMLQDAGIMLKQKSTPDNLKAS